MDKAFSLFPVTLVNVSSKRNNRNIQSLLCNTHQTGLAITESDSYTWICHKYEYNFIAHLSIRLHSHNESQTFKWQANSQFTKKKSLVKCKQWHLWWNSIWKENLNKWWIMVFDLMFGLEWNDSHSFIIEIR